MYRCKTYKTNRSVMKSHQNTLAQHDKKSVEKELTKPWMLLCWLSTVPETCRRFSVAQILICYSKALKYNLDLITEALKLPQSVFYS